MSERERYDATLALLAKRKELCEMAALGDPPPHGLNAVRLFIAVHDPATMLRVYTAAEGTLRRHGYADEAGGCGHYISDFDVFAGEHVHETWPCADALAVMDAWLPIAEETP